MTLYEAVEQYVFNKAMTVGDAQEKMDQEGDRIERALNQGSPAFFLGVENALIGLVNVCDGNDAHNPYQTNSYPWRDYREGTRLVRSL